MSGPDRVTRLLSAAASVNNTLCSAHSAKLYSIIGYNDSAAAVFIKIYDKATAPVAGTDTPKMTLYIPPTTAFVLDFPSPVKMNVGLGFALTGAGPDNDTTALSAADVLGLNVLFEDG